MKINDMCCRIYSDKVEDVVASINFLKKENKLEKTLFGLLTHDKDSVVISDIIQISIPSSFYNDIRKITDKILDVLFAGYGFNKRDLSRGNITFNPSCFFDLPICLSKDLDEGEVRIRKINSTKDGDRIILEKPELIYISYHDFNRFEQLKKIVSEMINQQGHNYDDLAFSLHLDDFLQKNNNDSKPISFISETKTNYTSILLYGSDNLIDSRITKIINGFSWSEKIWGDLDLLTITNISYEIDSYHIQKAKLINRICDGIVLQKRSST